MIDLGYIYSKIYLFGEIFDIFEKGYTKSTKRYIKAWHDLSREMSDYAEQHFDFGCYISIRKDRSCALYELNYDGAANVPQEHYEDSEMEISINLSPELYSRQLYIPDEQWIKYKEQFILTFVHEMTHSMQFDDNKDLVDDYYSSPFEIDAYSSELAFDMHLFNRKATECDAFDRYRNVDKKVSSKMYELAKQKYEYLKKHK